MGISIAGEPWFPAGLSVRAIMNTAWQKRKAAEVFPATLVICGSATLTRFSLLVDQSTPVGIISIVL
jgi:hypothetical protein